MIWHTTSDFRVILDDRSAHEAEKLDPSLGMIVAGVRAYSGCKWDGDIMVGAEKTVREVFLAMLSAAPTCHA